MKGLLLKDAYMMAKYCRTYLIMVIVFLAIGLINRENMFFILYPSLLSAMLPVTLLSYDERSKWDQYCGTLPCTRTQIVSGKYVIGIITHLAVVVVTLLAQIVSMFIRQEYDMESILILAVVLVLLPTLSTTITFPVMFRFGTEKGRIVYYIIIGVFCAVGVIATAIYDKFLTLEISFTPLGAFLCIAAIGLYALSWHLSIKFYESREL